MVRSFDVILQYFFRTFSQLRKKPNIKTSHSQPVDFSSTTAEFTWHENRIEKRWFLIESENEWKTKTSIHKNRSLNRLRMPYHKINYLSDTKIHIKNIPIFFYEKNTLSEILRTKKKNLDTNKFNLFYFIFFTDKYYAIDYT